MINKRVILLMGVQRSGTNALRKSLEHDTSIISYNEGIYNIFFEKWLLRPKKSYTEFLTQLNFKTVLLKPVQETRLKKIEEIITGFDIFNCYIIWPFRNPINVYYSQNKKSKRSIKSFIADWNKRNSDAIDFYINKKDDILFVEYEKLLTDKEYLNNIFKYTNINGKDIFLNDSNAGINTLSNPKKNRILIDTLSTHNKLLKISNSQIKS